MGAIPIPLEVAKVLTCLILQSLNHPPRRRLPNMSVFRSTPYITRVEDSYFHRPLFKTIHGPSLTSNLYNQPINTVGKIGRPLNQHSHSDESTWPTTTKLKTQARRVSHRRYTFDTFGCAATPVGGAMHPGTAEPPAAESKQSPRQQREKTSCRLERQTDREVD